MARGKRPSSAIARFRGAVIIGSVEGAKVLTATAAETATMPSGPIRRLAASATQLGVLHDPMGIR